MDMELPLYLEDYAAEAEQLPTQIKGKLTDIKHMQNGPTGFVPGEEQVMLEMAFRDVLNHQNNLATTPAEKSQAAEKALETIDDTIKVLDETLRKHEAELRKEGNWPAANSERPPPRPADKLFPPAGASSSVPPQQNHEQLSTLSPYNDIGTIDTWTTPADIQYE